MFSVLLIAVLFCFEHASCLRREPCGTDNECLVNAVIERVYPRFVAGMPGVESSDPLHLDAIIADLPNIRYELFNATLTGLKDCEFVKFNTNRVNAYTLFDYALSCPLLTLLAQYSLNGIIDALPVEGKGDCQILYGDLDISISGKHEIVEDDKGKHHINILDYTISHDLKKGRVKDPVYTNLVLDSQDSCDKRVTIIEEMTRNIVMDVFMNKFIKNLKKFQTQVPVEELHFKYVH